MPKARIKHEFICEICGQPHKTEEDAAKCEDGHDTILIRLERIQLRRLLNFLITGNPLHLTPDIVSTLQKYNKVVGGKI